MKTNSSKTESPYPFYRLFRLLKALGKPFIEVIDSIIARAFPWVPVLSFGIFLELFHLLKVDSLIARWRGFSFLIPQSSLGNKCVIFFFALLPFYGWGVFQTLLKLRLSRRLTEIFQAVGLKNNLGSLPNLVSDLPVDDTTRKLRVTRAILPLSSFENAKGALEGGLQIYIDEFRENRITGTVDITYAHSPLVEVFPFPGLSALKAFPLLYWHDAL